MVLLECDFCKLCNVKSSELLENLLIKFLFWDRCCHFSLTPQTYPDPVLRPVWSSFMTSSQKVVIPASSIITGIA